MLRGIIEHTLFLCYVYLQWHQKFLFLVVLASTGNWSNDKVKLYDLGQDCIYFGSGKGGWGRGVAVT